MDELYKEYGELMVQLEILNNRINQVKQKINEAISKKEEPKSKTK